MNPYMEMNKLGTKRLKNAWKTAIYPAMHSRVIVAWIK